MTWFQVQVIATMQCLLAMCRDIGTEVVFIGRLVVREPRVAIEPIRAVFHRQVTDRRVEGDDAANSLLYTLLKVCPNGIILLSMFLEPRAVVILRQLAQVLQNSFCIHNKPLLVVAKIQQKNEIRAIFRWFRR